MPALFRPTAPLLALVLLAAAAPGVSAAETAQRAFIGRLADAINEYRAMHALQPLAFAEELADLADEHSRQMAEQRRLSHEGFRARMGRTTSRLCVENVAHNFPTPETLVDGWRASPSHHRNLLEPGVSRMGLAAVGRYVTFFACR